jgi:glycosyltransferase involved in cell wall biosynthesis
VVVSAFTAERRELTAKAIASLQGQTAPAHEIFLVIDHSPAFEVECRERWPAIAVIPNREGKGLSGARNTGIAASEGEVVAFLDDDATAAPDWIERLLAAYEDPLVLGAGGAIRPSWSEGRPRWFPPEFDWVVGCTHSGMPREPTPVRNLVGAGMSFRREALEEVGRFRIELGRTGTLPSGRLAGLIGGGSFNTADDTDVCIRIHERRPEGRILFDPGATVDHFVPPERARLGYFLSRCRGEGRSKAVLATLVGSDAGLSEERSYMRRTLPLGFMRGLGQGLRGDLGGPLRAMVLVLGLLTTAAGYLAALPEARRAARLRRPSTELG